MTAETRLTEISDNLLKEIFPDGFDSEQDGEYYKLTGVSPLMDESKDVPQYHFRVVYENEELVNEFYKR